MPKKLTQQDYTDAAAYLAVTSAHIKTILEVEALGDGFDAHGNVKFLFEPSQFSKFTRHKFDKTHPLVSWPEWRPGGYGSQADNQRRFAEAVKLDENAAYLASSWGLPQILGANATSIGYSSGKEMAQAFQQHGEPEQLRAFVRLIDEWNLEDELRRGDWLRFAIRYNGKSQARHDYEGRLRRAFAKWWKLEGQPQLPPEVGYSYALQIPADLPAPASQPNPPAESVNTVRTATNAAPIVQPDAPPVKVFLQSLKNGYESIATTLGITGAAIFGFAKTHPQITAIAVIAALLIIWAYRTRAKLEIDKAVIANAADPTKNTVKPSSQTK